MFETLQTAPPDAILGLSEAYKQDPNPDKINLTVGVYQNATGATPILQSVRQAEQQLFGQEAHKSYLGIAGLAEFADRVVELLFGAEHALLADQRVVAVQTPGGTGALRVAGDFLHRNFPAARIWLSRPTWANHPNVFQAAGFDTPDYSYVDSTATTLDFEAMLAAFEQIPAGDVVCLHGCCHNPTGIDLDEPQWRTTADVLKRRGILPLVDFAYQGFGDGLEPDAAGVLALADAGCEMLVCSSFSKNFGLYGERVGGLTVVTGSAEQTAAALSNIKSSIRANYSNPPKHGAALVAIILADPQLRQMWEKELEEMRGRIHTMRRMFVDKMKQRMPDRDFSFIAKQRGMFSNSGLTGVQVDELRNRYAIYVVGNGRINVAGITESNIDHLCDAIASVA